MGGGRKSLVRRACLVAAAGCVALSVGLPALADEHVAVDAPAVWRGSATTAGATFEINRDALLPVPNALRFSALQGDSVYDTDLQTARASLLYPGEGVLQGPNLACGTFGASAPPDFQPLLDLCATYDYPLSVFADATVHDKSTTGSLKIGKPTDPISVDAVTAKAHADLDASTTDAVIKDLKVLGLPVLNPVPLLPVKELQLDPSIVRIAGGTARTRQVIDDAGRLVVESSSTLTGVDLVGGLIRIGSIRSISKATDDGNDVRTAAASFEVGGVTVGGVPAQITEQGLVIGAPGNGSGPLQQQLENAVRQLVGGLGIKLSLLPVSKTANDGTGQAVADAGGLLLEVALNVDGAPTVPGPLGDIDLNGSYVGTVQLARTAAAAGASRFDPDAPFVPSDEGFSPEFGGDGGFIDGGFVPGDPGSPGVNRPIRPTPGPNPVPGVEPVSTDLFGGRLELLYLAFALAVLGLCITPRLAVPARLPGPGA